MEKPVDALTQHEVFVRELIYLYKQKPELWQIKHPGYRNRAQRAQAFEALVRKAQEYNPEADEDFVRTKIESMRGSFRKERKRVLQSKQNCTNPEQIHKPSLWYYDLLMFTVGGGENETNVAEVQPEEVVYPENGNGVKTPFWSREHSAILISHYKNHPCLYAASHPCYRNKRRRNEALKKITDKLIEATGKHFNSGDVRKKISLIRGQFLYEYKKVKGSESQGKIYNPTLWCYEMLSFLKEEYTNPKKITMRSLESPQMGNNRRKDTSSEDSEDDVDIKKESDSSLSSESVHMESTKDDIFHTIGRNLAHKLRDMTEHQRAIADKIVRDVMYHGQMEHLTDKSRLSLDGA